MLRAVVRPDCVVPMDARDTVPLRATVTDELPRDVVAVDGVVTLFLPHGTQMYYVFFHLLHFFAVLPCGILCCLYPLFWQLCFLLCSFVSL